MNIADYFCLHKKKIQGNFRNHKISAIGIKKALTQRNQNEFNLLLLTKGKYSKTYYKA